MGLERTAGVEQLLGLAQGLRRASYDALGLTRHTRRAVRQRPAKPVTRPGIARTSLGVAVTIHDTSLRSRRTRGGVSRRLPGAAKAPDVGSTTLSRRPRSLTNSTTQSQGLIEHLVSVRLRPRACHERQTSPRGWGSYRSISAPKAPRFDRSSTAPIDGSRASPRTCHCTNNAACQCVGVAAFQLAGTRGFAALPDLARFENPADRRGQLNGQAPSSRLEDLVAGVGTAASTLNDDRQTRASTPTRCAPTSS